MSEADRAALLPIINTVVSGAMDVIVQIANGEIDLGKMCKNCKKGCIIA